jgi:hypothetical protein
MKQQTNFILKSKSVLNNTSTYQFKIEPAINEVKRYPDSLLGALSKIGGMKALIGLGLLVVTLFHERMFERNITSEF